MKGFGVCNRARAGYTAMKFSLVQSRNMQIKFIPMRWGRGDNYSYVITDDETKKSWLIDPAEPNEVIPELQKMDIRLEAIVNTHHHHDHSGGNEIMVQVIPGLPLIAGKDSPYVTYTPRHKEVIKLGNSIEIQALHTPCHTMDSICYYLKDTKTDEKAVISGDTLFNSGCGRFFEGTAEDMNYSLNEVLAELPGETLVYPGHEYTMGNVQFSKTVLGKDNQDILDLELYCLNNKYSTGKFTILDEKKFNPFMRLSDPKVIKSVGSSDPVEIVKRLREMKNNF